MNPGDYCVIQTHGWAAWWIRLVTRSRFNHAAIYIGGGQIIEANPAGVQVSPLSNYDGYLMLRSDLHLDPARAAAVVQAAQAQLGLEYGWLDVLAIALSTIGIRTRKLDDPDSRFCSQLVMISEDAAGRPYLTLKAANRVTPGDLALILVGQPVPANW